MLDHSSSSFHAGVYLLLATALAILFASHMPVGAALSMDSLYYLSTAGNILDGNGISYNTYALSGPAFEATTLWPPLYPVLVAAIQWLAQVMGLSDVVGIAIFNVLASLTSVYLIIRITSQTGPLAAGVVVAFAFAISPSIQIVFLYAWSEVLFIPLTLAAYFSLQQYLIGDESVRQRSLFAIVILLGLATYTRYVGLVFFATTALAMLIFGHGEFTKKVRSVAVASLAYVVFLIPMLLRNFSETGSLSGGDRGSPDMNALSDIATLAWYMYREFVNLPVVIGVGLIVVAMVFVAWLLLRRTPRTEQARPAFWSSSVVMPFMIAFGYLAFLLVSRHRQHIDLDSRMLSVVVPFLLLGLLGIYRQLALRADDKMAGIPFLILLVAFALGAANTHTDILKGWRDLGEPGPLLGKTYRSMTGRQMETLRGIDEYFAPAEGDIVLTDINQPIIVDYLFSNADVRRLPDVPDDKNVVQLEATLQRQGLAIIGSTAWSQALSNGLDGRAHFYNIEGKAENSSYAVITLPVDTK